MSAVTGIDYTRESLEFDAERISNMLRVMTAISFNIHFGSKNLREDHDAIPAWIFDKEPDFQPFEEGTIKMDRDDMEKAKDMLAAPNPESIKKIANDVGYEDAYHFSKLFKKYYGVSPLHYKKKIS